MHSACPLNCACVVRGQFVTLSVHVCLNVCMRCEACPLNCQSCTVDLNSDTVARCTECNSNHRLIDATISSVDVAGNCYSTYLDH